MPAISAQRIPVMRAVCLWRRGCLTRKHLTFCPVIDSDIDVKQPAFINICHLAPAGFGRPTCTNVGNACSMTTDADNLCFYRASGKRDLRNVSERNLVTRNIFYWCAQRSSDAVRGTATALPSCDTSAVAKAKLFKLRILPGMTGRR